MKLMISLATRGRPQQVVETIRKSMANWRHPNTMMQVQTDLDDEATFVMLRRGDSMGVFQLEGGPMRSLMRSLAPTTFDDVAALAKQKNAATFSGTDLDSFLKIPEVGARLRTRQDPARILAYYKGKLIAAGLVRVS